MSFLQRIFLFTRKIVLLCSFLFDKANVGKLVEDAVLLLGHLFIWYFLIPLNIHLSDNVEKIK